eukprot:scaffold2292_cov259-Chaetoceros_neogracile.AAC.6
MHWTELGLISSTSFGYILFHLSSIIIPPAVLAAKAGASPVYSSSNTFFIHENNEAIFCKK